MSKVHKGLITTENHVYTETGGHSASDVLLSVLYHVLVLFFQAEPLGPVLPPVNSV